MSTLASALAVAALEQSSKRLIGESETSNPRELIEEFDRHFRRLHLRTAGLIGDTSVELLYRSPPPISGQLVYSVGESLLRSAASVEQTFGGITANLWDDPFEWTLPENLSTTERLLEYLEEVEATRERAFLCFTRDTDLLKEVLVPGGNTRPLVELLRETVAKAQDFQGRAIATLALLRDDTGEAHVVER